MPWKSASDIATNLLSGNIIAIIVTCLVAILLPILLHVFLYRASSVDSPRDFLILGPSGTGKTTFCLLLEQGSASSQKHSRATQTQTSQTSSVISAVLHPCVRAGSNRYRSSNDPSLAQSATKQIRCKLRDTPGHGKLRSSQGISQLLTASDSKPTKNGIRGVIFLIDAARLSDPIQLSDTAGYLYDILMVLQAKAHKHASQSKRRFNIPLLVAANKQDLFAAVPPELVNERLETEINKIRQTRSSGIANADITSSTNVDEHEILCGDDAQQHFRFKSLAVETGVKVDVIGGTAKGGDGADIAAGVRPWEEWIASCL